MLIFTIKHVFDLPCNLTPDPSRLGVQPASVQALVGAAPVLTEAKTRAPEPQLVWGDGRYQGPLVAQAAQAVGLRVEVVSKPPDSPASPQPPTRWSPGDC